MCMLSRRKRPTKFCYTTLTDMLPRAGADLIISWTRYHHIVPTALTWAITARLSQVIELFYTAEYMQVGLWTRTIGWGEPHQNDTYKKATEFMLARFGLKFYHPKKSLENYTFGTFWWKTWVLNWQLISHCFVTIRLLHWAPIKRGLLCWRLFFFLANPRFIDVFTRHDAVIHSYAIDIYLSGEETSMESLSARHTSEWSDYVWGNNCFIT